MSKDSVYAEILSHVNHQVKGKLGVVLTCLEDIEAGLNVDNESVLESLSTTRWLVEFHKHIQEITSLLEFTPYASKRMPGFLKTCIEHNLRSSRQNGTKEESTNCILSISSESGDCSHKAPITCPAKSAKTLLEAFSYPNNPVHSIQKLVLETFLLNLNMAKVTCEIQNEQGDTIGAIEILAKDV